MKYAYIIPQYDAVVSLPVRGAWIEMPCAVNPRWKESSLPVRGAWIEIHVLTRDLITADVAPRAGSVD